MRFLGLNLRVIPSPVTRLDDHLGARRAGWSREARKAISALQKKRTWDAVPASVALGRQALQSVSPASVALGRQAPSECLPSTHLFSTFSFLSPFSLDAESRVRPTLVEQPVSPTISPPLLVSPRLTLSPGLPASPEPPARPGSPGMPGFPGSPARPGGPGGPLSPRARPGGP